MLSSRAKKQILRSEYRLGLLVEIQSIEGKLKEQHLKFSDLEEKLSSYGQGGYHLLELFIIELLKIEANSNGQLLQTEPRTGWSQFDAFAPNGLGGIPGPVLIEVMFSLNRKRLDTLFSRPISPEDRIEKAVLIVTLREWDQRSKYLQELVANINANLYIWGEAELQALIDKHGHAAHELTEKLFSLRLETAIHRGAEDWLRKREEILIEVGSCYRAGRFSLWLGAGVSSSAGLPDWTTLLNSLFVSMLTDEAGKTEKEKISSIVKRLRQVDGPSALMLARYIRKGLSAGSAQEHGKFIDAVTEQLYGLRDASFAIDSLLLKAIAGLCMPSRTGARVRAVLTYNFDDLVERVLLDRAVVFRSIFEEIDMASPEELPIYHVHGFLPENRELYSGINKSTLVFSEEGYHHIYREAYHWSNLIQLSNLKETTCLMVGLSLTDPNLRRLLEISVKTLDKPRHFAFLKRISVEKFMEQDDKKDLDISTVKTFLKRHHSLNEEVMRELGVNVIWYEDYSEIPSMLAEIGSIG